MHSLVHIRVSIALVWLYQGLWCKLLVREPRHQAIIRTVPYLEGAQARAALFILGAAEACLGAWVASGWRAPQAALVQTGLVLLMNGGGIIWARRIIPDPTGMLVQNFVFLTLVWVAAGLL
jgi:hypothetical protein